MTDTQTEARAIARYEFTCPDCDPYVVEVNHGQYVRYADHTAALAAKDAELAQVIKTGFERCADITARAERAEAQLAEARKALEQIERKICAAEHGHTINDVLANYREVRRTVQDARAARRALEAQGGENG